MTDSGVDSEPSPSSPDSDARSASPRLISLLRRSASPSGMTLLRRSASPSGMTLLRRSASPAAACAVIRRNEPAAAAILLNTWRSAEGSAAAAAAATSATEEDDDDEEEDEEEKITLYRSEEDCEHPPSSILRLESSTSSTVRLENPSSAPSVSLENPSSSSSSSCSQLESLETVEEKMETVEALLSLSDSSRSPLASPEKQSGQPGTGKTKNMQREEKQDMVFLLMYYGLHFFLQQYSKMTLMVCLYSELYSLRKTSICFNLKFGHIPLFMCEFFNCTV
jgi:hypothetical protein